MSAIEWEGTIRFLAASRRAYTADHVMSGRIRRLDISYPKEQSWYDELVRLWSVHRQRSFPSGCGGAVVEGICLVTFDCDLFELVSAYIRHRKLKPRNVRALRELKDDLRRVLPALSDEAAVYFREWEELVYRTLRLVETGNPNRNPPEADGNVC